MKAVKANKNILLLGKHAFLNVWWISAIPLLTLLKRQSKCLVPLVGYLIMSRGIFNRSRNVTKFNRVSSRGKGRTR